MLSFFNTREIEAFASELAADLTRRFPPSSQARTDTGAKNQLKIILEGLAARAARFQDQHELGVYKKAKLANVFRWKLSEAGYTKDFVEAATKSIVTRIATPRRAR